MKKKPNSRARASLHTRIVALVPTPAQAGAWLALLVFVFLTAAALTGRDRMAATTETVIAAPADPTYLSDEDRSHYAMIRRAQEAGDYDAADALIKRLSNRGLVGYALATRYLGSDYTASNTELSQWLTLYSDHPQAPYIASLAIRRGLDVTLPKTVQALRGEGYSDHLGRSTMPDSWFTALSQWRDGNYADAKTIFVQLSADASLSPWHRAAAHYWTYRAAGKTHAPSLANHHLHEAAKYGSTFYGMLAASQLGMLDSGAEAPEVSDSLRNDPRAIRAALLVQLDDAELAENELRILHSATPKGSRGGIVTLASELNMPNLQMRLARTEGLSDAEQRFAQFPMPHYLLDLHSVMDSSLLLAVARNESGFREVAQSPAGAVGMMQMLPSTARAVERHVGKELLQLASSSDSNAPIAERLSDPSLSARYGAEYLKLLSRTPAINNNLIHLLVGYNAGIGRVISWKAASGTMADPLLYIESMPYAETRNYVMQVSAQYWTYQLMMDETPTTLRALSQGKWPTVKAGA